MQLEELLQQNKITLPEDIRLLCFQAIDFMSKAKDPIHDRKHIFRMLSDLQALLKNSSEITMKKINFPVLLLTICWHDVWRSGFFPTNLISLFFTLLWDGIGGAFKFLYFANKENLNNSTKNSVFRIISDHGVFRLFVKESLEQKIFFDLDFLEEYNLIRIVNLKARFLNNKSRSLLRLGKFYFEHFLKKPY